MVSIMKKLCKKISIAPVRALLSRPFLEGTKTFGRVKLFGAAAGVRYESYCRKRWDTSHETSGSTAAVVDSAEGLDGQ
jgi:hypothetical protein